MKTKMIFRLLFLLGIMTLLNQCKPKVTDVFEGRVITFKGEGLDEAEVEINGTKTKSQKDGTFSLKLEKVEKVTHLINVRKDGFATYSQSLATPSKDLKLTLYEATVVSVDPTKEIKVTDTKSKDRPGPLAVQANWAGNPLAAVPLVIRNNKIVDMGFPADFGKAFEYLLNRKAGEGISITIPANTLVSTSSQSAPAGNVNVAVSTIDIFSPGAMPGDYAVRREGREAGFLISYGAGFIDIYDGKDRYQLKKGASATLTIPVDESQLVYGDSIPASIPLYLFDEKIGAWVDHGKATLSADKKSYVGEVRHFSTFNVDIENSTPACVSFQFDPTTGNTPPVPLNYGVEILIPVGGSIITRTKPISEPGGSCSVNAAGYGLHGVIRLPANQDICTMFFDGNRPMGVFVTQSSDPYNPTVPPVCDPTGYQSDPPPAGSATVFCSSFSWSLINQPIIAVGLTTVGGVKQVKWAHDPAGATITYKVIDCATSTEIVQSNFQTFSIPSLTVKINQADLPIGTSGTLKIQAFNGTTLVAESSCVSI